MRSAHVYQLYPERENQKLGGTRYKKHNNVARGECQRARSVASCFELCYVQTVSSETCACDRSPFNHMTMGQKDEKRETKFFVSSSGVRIPFADLQAAYSKQNASFAASSHSDLRVTPSVASTVAPCWATTSRSRAR